MENDTLSVSQFVKEAKVSLDHVLDRLAAGDKAGAAGWLGVARQQTELAVQAFNRHLKAPSAEDRPHA